MGASLTSMIKKRIKNLINKLPYIKTLIKELEVYKKGYYPGHYYSPIVSVDELNMREKEIFTIKSREVQEIDLNESKQLELLKQIKENYQSIPFADEKQSHLRYYYNNGFYCQSDGIILNLIIQHFKPKSIIEVGSGFTSALMLDTNEIFFNNSIQLTFIEPYPERLYSLFKPTDKSNCQTIVSNLQNVNLDIFDELNANDILFIDSTHVSKTDSDVNRILFEILPRLKKGVLVHFHDVFFPFEYPKDWVLNWSGFGWNEAYILRAFLMYNAHYSIIMYNTFLELFYKDWFKENMPDCLKNEGGSIWLVKL